MAPSSTVFVLLFSFIISYARAATSTSLQACLSSAAVPASFPSSSSFSQLSQPYNLRLTYQPAAIALPTTPQQVSKAVLCAKGYGKVQARSGGHSYYPVPPRSAGFQARVFANFVPTRSASFGLGGQNNSTVIDLSALNSVSVDAFGIARVGGGMRLGNLALGIYNQSKRALPHGVCPGVGIGGHASHGGYWYSSRGWGLTLDTIVGLDVVLANGSFVHASAKAYPDIYWALRGAADSIGIITSFYFQTQPAPSSIVNWAYTIPISSPRIAASAFAHIQKFALNASVIDEKIGFGVSPKPFSFSITGTYRGDHLTFTNKISPELLRGLPTPSSQSVQSLDWISSLTNLWGGPIAQPLSGYNAHDNFYAKSVLVPESSPLTKPALRSYFTYLTSNGTVHPALWFSEINLLGGPSSVINNPPPPAANAAYSERSALWVVQHYSGTPSASNGGAKRAIDFVSGLNNALESAMAGTAFGGYLNYVDPELSPRQAHGLYYSKAVYQRLVEIKRVVDPWDLFWNPQAVGSDQFSKVARPPLDFASLVIAEDM